MNRVRNAWIHFSYRCNISLRTRPFCSNSTKKPSSDNGNADLARYHETYRQLHNLDFKTAAKILFTDPPKKKKFGLDFHLVQLFFACMPSLAIYLIAQYARHDMKRMEAEREQKMKLEEEEKATNATKKSEPVEGMVSRDKLKEVVKEILVEMKQSDRSITENSKDVDDKKDSAIDQNKMQSDRDGSNFVEKGHLSPKKSTQTTPNLSQESPGGSATVSSASMGDQRGNIQNGKSSQKSK